jgi:UDP-2,3-diacylglucosamine hydrolase
MRRVFVSDLHLEDALDRRFAGFAHLLAEESAWADELWILGDLCEMWIGDDDDSPLVERLASVLRDASARARIVFIAGNRDFLLGDVFARRAGIERAAEPTLLAGRLLVGHGDALCTDDDAYQGMRKVLRSTEWQTETLGRPLTERRAMGAELRARSRRESANKPENIMDVSEDAFTELMATHGAAALIHGHTHRPGVHRAKAGERWVLGAWEQCGWLVRQVGEHLDLECFALQSPLPEPKVLRSDAALGPVGDLR